MSGGTDLPARRGPAAVRNIALTNKLAACEGVTAQHPVLLEREDCKLVAWYRSLYAPRTGGGVWQSPSDGGNCWLHSAARQRRGRSRAQTPDVTKR